MVEKYEVARKYFVRNALRPYIKFVEELPHRRIGENIEIEKIIRVADCLLNLPDYIYAEVPRTAKIANYKAARFYRESLWPLCPAYEVLCDVGNSYKHRQIGRDRRRMDDVTQIEEVGAICLYRDGQGQYYRTVKCVLIRKDNEVLFAGRMLMLAMSFWIRELIDLAIIPPRPINMPSYNEFVRRDDKRFLEPLTVVCTESESVTMNTELFEFCDQTNFLVSVQSKTPFKGTANYVLQVIPSPFQAAE